MSQPFTIADKDELGSLGIRHLKHYWSRTLAPQMGVFPPPATAEEQVADTVLLAGLRVGIRETLEVLMTRPTFPAFEEWVLAKNGGALDPAVAGRINQAVAGEAADPLASILDDPVLSEEELAFWDENGYVIVKEAISKDVCKDAVEAIYSHAGADPHTPDSWYHTAIWILFSHHPALWAVRDSPRIHTAFAQLWGRRDLWMNVDVCGINPPERPGYSFQGSPLHWDMTLARPLHFGTQGMLYLTDTAENQGAFSCVPGFHRELENWLDSLPPNTDARAHAQATLKAIPLAGNAGDLIIWHQALPHAATPNRAASPRLVQYLNMFPSQYGLTTDWQ